MSGQTVAIPASQLRWKRRLAERRHPGGIMSVALGLRGFRCAMGNRRLTHVVGQRHLPSRAMLEAGRADGVNAAAQRSSTVRPQRKERSTETQSARRCTDLRNMDVEGMTPNKPPR